MPGSSLRRRRKFATELKPTLLKVVCTLGGRKDPQTVLECYQRADPVTMRAAWIVVQRGGEEDVDVCLTDPGHPVTLTVTAKPRTLVDLLMGDAELAEALRRRLVLVEGERELARRFEALFDFEGAESFTGGARHDGQIVGAHPVGE